MAKRNRPKDEEPGGAEKQEAQETGAKKKAKSDAKTNQSGKGGDVRTAAPAGSNWAALRKQIGAKKRPAKIAEAVEKRESETSATRPGSLGTGTALTSVVAIDCEMVGVGPDGDKSSLARVCIVNNLGNVLLDVHVKQKLKVTDYRTHVSGIRPSDLTKGAEPLEEVQKRVHEIIKGRILVGHAIRNDLNALLIGHPRKLIRDTAKYPPLMREPRPGRKLKPRALKKLAAEHLGFEIQAGEHSPVDDARCALYLYHKHRKEWEKSLRIQKAELIRKAKEKNPNLKRPKLAP